jgi:hypothetical protein
MTDGFFTLATVRAVGSVDKIPYQDKLGRYADFHALRKTLGTNLAIAGVPLPDGNVGDTP